MKEQKRGIASALAVCLTLLNTHRYNLPARVWLKDVFNLLNVYCWLIAIFLLWIYEDRPAIKSLYFFGGCGVLNALLNESFFVPTLPAWSENLYMFAVVVLTIPHYLYHKWKMKGKINDSGT